MRRFATFTAAALIALLGCATFVAAGRAEVFVLKSGGRIEGELLNRERAAGQAWQLRTGSGVRLALADSAVQRVIAKTDLDKQYEALLPKTPNTVAGQWAMAQWCQEAGLEEQRKRHLQAIITLDPDHTEARKALGYQRHGSRWFTQDEYMQNLGYVRYKGAWRFKQEVEIDSLSAQGELAVKEWRRDIRRWIGHVASGSRHAAEAERELAAIRDPEAAPALADILTDRSQPRAIRELALNMLQKLPPGLATGALVNVALDDPDGRLQGECLDELKRQGAHRVRSLFVRQLTNKDNARINRAGQCLERLEDKSATLPLINALVTEHKRTIQMGQPGGGLSANFSGNGGSPGLSMGNSTRVIKESLNNAGVHAALVSLYPGVDFRYDIEAWRAWYAETQATSQVDLRRDP
jgi:hypothetical protein